MQIRRLFPAALAAALAVPTLPAAAASFTMRDVLSAPYVASLATSPAGDELLWKVHLRGTRNVYLYAGGTTHRVTAYDKDDGQDLDDIQFVPGHGQTSTFGWERKTNPYVSDLALGRA